MVSASVLLMKRLFKSLFTTKYSMSPVLGFWTRRTSITSSALGLPFFKEGESLPSIESTVLYLAT